jgi:hypothetical protein
MLMFSCSTAFKRSAVLCNVTLYSRIMLHCVDLALDINFPSTCNPSALYCIYTPNILVYLIYTPNGIIGHLQVYKLVLRYRSLQSNYHCHEFCRFVLCSKYNIMFINVTTVRNYFYFSLALFIIYYLFIYCEKAK